MTKTDLWEKPIIDDDILIEQDLFESTLLIRLKQICARFKQTQFASSLAAEDMVITDMIVRHRLPIGIFTLDTGKLHQETLELLLAVKKHYQINIKRIQPDKHEVEKYERQFGSTAIYESLDLRKKCCYIRKIEPLNRALLNVEAWLSGQRREQSETRQKLDFEEQDKTRLMTKFNPIFDWTEKNVWAYIKSHRVPVNVLYEKGYSSIGCEPCSKPVRKDEDIRAGRWWWENKENKECGLHTTG